MPSLSSTYLLPAILLNPAFILHLINTFVSHWVPPPPTASVSPHPFMESIGPVPGSKPYMDMHADDQLCWSYTAIMVFVQILAFGRVQDNRVRRKSAKAAKIEREKARKEKLAVIEKERRERKMNSYTGGMDGMCELLEEYECCANGNDHANGILKTIDIKIDDNGDLKEETYSEESLTETSEEEMLFI